MSNKIKKLAIILACLVIVLIAVGTLVQGAGKKSAISDGEYAKAWVQVQNTMSKHNYYHGVGNHYTELLDIWVKEDGDYAKTATFSNPHGVWEGIDLIKVFYGNPRTKDPNQSLKEMSINEPFVPGKGGWGIHMNTTPVIEIAGDGKTAKGIWYSPGVVMNFTGQKDKDGNPLAQGTWFWEKYGADFVKEDGKWKIWHIQMYYEFTPPVGFESKWTNPNTTRGAMREAAEQSDEEQVASMGMQLPDATRPNPNPYAEWGPERVNEIRPELPVPYYTFSETFSY